MQIFPIKFQRHATPAPVTDGIVLDHHVVYPLHDCYINLNDGQDVPPDVGCDREAQVVYLSNL